MKDFQEFQEEVKHKTLQDRRKEAFDKSREQLKKAAHKPERPKTKPVASQKIKSGGSQFNVVRAITSAAKSAMKRLG